MFDSIGYQLLFSGVVINFTIELRHPIAMIFETAAPTRIMRDDADVREKFVTVGIFESLHRKQPTAYATRAGVDGGTPSDVDNVSVLETA